MRLILKERERDATNNVMMYLKLLEKQEQAKSQTNRKIIKIWARINKVETKKTGSQTLVAHTRNPSYLGGRDQED
jgi:ribosomal protein S19